jgi:hypothetical protein
MSDVAYAPAPSAPAPAPANEVPINPNPTNAPAPLGNQAPDKPAGETERQPSRRESIQKAFDRARTENPPKPREARMGDNNPPEETKVEKRAAAREKLDPIDLKKRPADQPQRERAEHGHFAPREPQQARDGRQQGTQQQPGTQQGAPGIAPHRNPPQRFSERAKAEWQAAPDSVRSEVYRMATEFHHGFEKYKADRQEMNTLRPFQEQARQQGTTLHRALSNYTAMEQKLRTDVVGGLDVIVHNLNLRTPDGQRLGLRDIAWHILNQSPEQHRLTQNQNAQTAQSQQIGQLHQMVNTLASGIHRMQYQQQFSNTRSALDQYADAHPRFDELGDLIEHEIKLGFDLDTAYRRAELLRPATHAAQTRTNSTTAQTRTSDRSIRGAPSGPSNGTSQRSSKPVGRREAISNAIKRVNGSL